MDFTESDVMDNEDEVVMYTQDLDIPVAHQAAAQGNIDNLTEAIKADPTMLEHQDTEGLTPLAHAVMGEKIESMKLLVKIGASLNSQDSLGRTCLSMAAYQGWHDGVVFLLRNGAKQNIAEKCGRTALHSATYPTDTNVLSALLQTVTEDDIGLQDYEGMTALHWACFHNRPTHAQLLLLKGSEPFMQDMDGRTPLHWACQNGSLECVTVLVHIDTSNTLVNVPDFSGKSPLHFAAAAGHSSVIRELTTVNSVELQAEDNDERTPLHWAAASGQAEALKTLLDLGVDPNPVDVDEGTPLDYARQSGHKECVRILEEHLGLRSTESKSEDENPLTQSNISTTDSNNKTRTKNPFGFIVDLFRPRAAKVIGTKSESDYRTGEQDISGESLETECGNNIEELRAMHSSTQHQGSSSVPNSRLSTPVKRQRDSDVLRSMEMIHLSREDNPLLQKIRNSEQNLREVHPSHGSMNLGGDVNKTRHESEGSGSESPINQFNNILIRSPPPVIKRQHSPLSRENSLSPVPSTAFSGRSEYTRAQIENDAAEILALHNHVLGSSQTSTPRSHISKLSSDESPRLQGSPLTTSEDDGYMDKDIAYGRKIRLAPLKGPVPRQLSPGQLLNKHLDHVRQEESRENRPPTPPAQNNGSPASTSSSHNSPKIVKRKKKRKNNSTGEVSDNKGRNESADNNTNNLIVDREQEDISSPRIPTPLEQRKAIDKSIRTLLQ